MPVTSIFLSGPPERFRSPKVVTDVDVKGKSTVALWPNGRHWDGYSSLHGPWANGHTPLSLGRGASRRLPRRGWEDCRSTGLAQRLAHSGPSLKDPVVPPRTKDRWAASGMEGGAGQVCGERGGGAGAGEGEDGRARAQQVRVGWAGPPSGRGLQVRGHAPEGG